MDGAIELFNPDVIVFTQAFSFLSVASRRRPMVGVVTDFGVHTYWTRERADLYITAGPQAASLIAARGVPKERVLSAGIPIHPAFESAPSKEDAKAALGIPAGSLVILVTGGHNAFGPLRKIVDVLRRSLPGAYFLVGCGSNRSLAESLNTEHREGLKAFATLPPADMMRLMSASDFLIGKAGGLTCSEALSVGLPLLLFEPLPGQEQANCGYLLSRGAALRAENLEQLVSMAEFLGRERPVLAGMSLRSKGLGRPGAARAAARAILDIGLKAH